jgi:cyanate permease
MGIVSSLFEIPEFVKYMFLPTLTEEERERLAIDFLALLFMVGAIFGMLFYALFSVFYPFFFA